MFGVNHVIDSLQKAYDSLWKDTSTIISMQQKTYELLKTLSDTHVQLNGLVKMLVDNLVNINDSIKDLNNRILKLEKLLENREDLK